MCYLTINYYSNLDKAAADPRFMPMNLGFALVSFIPIIAVIIYQVGLPGRLYLTGVSLLSLLVPAFLLAFYTDPGWMLTLGTVFLFTAGFFLIALGLTLRRKTRLKKGDIGPAYCTNCSTQFPEGKDGEPCPFCLPSW